MLVKILVGVAVAVAGLAIVIALQPSTYRVSRSVMSCRQP